jgi:Mg2+ and Co2+ transporter CorA
LSRYKGALMADQDISTAILFDRDEVEHLGSLSQRPKRLNGSRLLWVDIDRRTQASADEVAAVFDLEERTQRRLASSEGRAVFVDEGRYIHVTTYSPCNEEGRETELTALECVVGKNWVITAHDRSLDVLEEFADRVSGSGDTGSLDGPAFLATLWSGSWELTHRHSSGSKSAWRSSTFMRCEGMAMTRTSKNLWR